MFASVLATLIATTLVCGGVYYLWEARQNRRPGRTVYVGSNLTHVRPVIAQVTERYLHGESERYHFVELGAGLAYVASVAGRQYRWRSVQAVEVAWTIYLTARLRRWLRRDPVTIHRGDVLSWPVPRPSLIYCYLFSEVTDRLASSGAFNGSVVICTTFPLTAHEPAATIPLAGWQKAAYIYDFRGDRETKGEPSMRKR